MNITIWWIHRSMRSEKAQSHSFILCHIIFSTKDRVRVLDDQYAPDLHAYTAAVLSHFGCPAVQIGGVEDHLHILCKLSRTRTIADTAKEVKIATSKWLKDKDTAFDDFYWQGGYGAFSVSQSMQEQVCTYIQCQAEHHKTMTFQTELRAFFNEYGIAFDEHYVWG